MDALFTPLFSVLYFMLMLKIELLPIDSIKAAPWNPRTLSAKDLGGLKASILNDQDFLQCRPVLVRKETMEIYAGNQRWTACKALGMEIIPAIITDITEEEAKIRAAKDNAHHGQNSVDYGSFLESLAQEGLDLGEIGHDIDLMQNDLELPKPQQEGRQPLYITCPECGEKFDMKRGINKD